MNPPEFRHPPEPDLLELHNTLANAAFVINGTLYLWREGHIYPARMTRLLRGILDELQGLLDKAPDETR